MPFVDAPIDTYSELQYLLKKAISFLRDKGYLKLKPKVSDDEKAFLDSIGLFTFEDLIYAEKKQVEAIQKRKELFQFILEFFAWMNRKYVYSFNDGNIVFDPKRATEIIKGNNYRFLSRPINFYLYPQLANRIRKAMNRVNISKYADLKNFLTLGNSIDFRGCGLESFGALCTIIISDYEYLTENNLLGDSIITKEQTTLELFETLLNESWEKQRKKLDIVFLNKWTFQLNYLRDDISFALRNLYGENNAQIILNKFLPEENKSTTEEMAKKFEISVENVRYIETILLEDYLSAFTNVEMINSNEENRASKFFKTMIRLGKNEMAAFIGILMMYFPVYPIILERVGKAFPSIGLVFNKIEEYMYEIDCLKEA